MANPEKYLAARAPIECMFWDTTNITDFEEWIPGCYVDDAYVDMAGNPGPYLMVPAQGGMPGHHPVPANWWVTLDTFSQSIGSTNDELFKERYEIARNWA
jgi:hypothetical protein